MHTHVKRGEIRKKVIIYFSFILAILVSLIFIKEISAVQPFGANYTFIKSERAPADTPQAIPAQAGNVTELNIFGYTTTQSWQGYFGNVSGVIQLADANDNVMYNWSVASPQGEVYASTNDSIRWDSVMCFNYTATGTYGDDSVNVGNTSLYGMNLTQLESMFNINPDDVDGVDETFNLRGLGTHDTFYTANLEFSEGECWSTRIFDNSGQGVNDHFEEVLLYDYSTRSVIFVSLLEEDILGFDNKTHDFEMMVLEDGHKTDTQTTAYYFYVELQ